MGRSFAESENTAILFMCGLLFPFETMPPFMAKFGAALPITMGIRALDSVLIYQQGFEVLMKFISFPSPQAITRQSP